MESFSPESSPAEYFGFDDVNGFKDMILAVILEAPDSFAEEDWLPPDQQMNLERAFVGLRYGIEIAYRECGRLPQIEKSANLIEEAYSLYKQGDDAAGQSRLEEVERLFTNLG